MDNLKRAVAVCLVTFAAGCSGTMQGMVRGSGEPVSFAYEQGAGSDTLTTSIDGEAFKGKAVMRGARATVGNVFGVGDGFGTATVVGTSSTGDMVATLLGSRGSSLSCQLQYADASGFTGSGGVGVCRHSDGRIIDMVW